MYQIQETRQAGQTILLIPSMMDDHFPLLQYAFHSEEYWPVILNNTQGITDQGLRYGHNDMCYPFTLCLGQYLQALASGEYDLDHTALLMPSAGDACRGSNFTSLIRKGLAAAGYPQVPVLTLNVKGLEREQALSIRPDMVWRALFALYYGDLLMLLTHQTRPYEREKGSTDTCRAAWTERLAQDLKTGRGLTLGRMKKNFTRMAAEFAAIPRIGGPKKRVGLVGELYTKYCALGNWDMVAFLEGEGCEAAVNGFSWYILYYVDNQIAGTSGPRRAGWKAVSALLAGLQRSMTEALRAHGFCCLDPFPAFRCQAERDMSMNLQVADGWLMGAELAAHLRSGCARVLAMQPFGCLPNHVCGRGQYAALARRFPQGKVVSVDLDSSGSPAQVYNRVKMLLEG